MDRRAFITASTAALLVRPALAAPSPIVLRPATVSQRILPLQYQTGPTQLLGFNGSVPGPTIRAVQNETLTVGLDNALDAGAAVHWHGVRLDNAMDGVPGMTQPLVAPGARFTYRFTPPDAGTYWYHSHYLSYEQVARGLMGPLIVEDSSPLDVDHDITAVLSDWRLTPEGELTEDFGNRHDIAHAGRMGNFAKAFLPEDVTLRRGERVRLRLINAATDRIFPLAITGLDAHIVALDGMPLPTPRPFDGPMLAPAQRMDLIADVTGPDKVALVMRHQQGAYPLGEISIVGDVTPRPPASITALPPNRADVPDMQAPVLPLVMQGGAMSGGHGGGDIWAFNGLSGMKDAPFARVTRGESRLIRLVNDTRFAHAIHLHGHHFFEMREDGSFGDYRDTSLVMAGQTLQIACLFDNPGKWMLHCHMLTHQNGGMTSWIDVV